jgi:drug/metabolite transporter (DMT)-like permease
MQNNLLMFFSQGVFFMILSAGSFCMMTVFVKLAGNSLPTIQIVFVRGLFTLIVTGFFLLKSKINPLGKNKRLLMARGLSGTIALFLVYESIQRFPLSEATVIQYLYPLFTAMIATALISEAVDKNILIGLFAGFFGVYVILGFPSLSNNYLDIESLAIAICGSLLTGLAYVLIRKATILSEHPLVVMFYFPLFTVPICLPFLFSVWEHPSLLDWGYLFFVGLFTQFGQLFLTYGYKQLPAMKAAPISYIQVFFATIIGIVFFDEKLTFNFLMGSIIVFFSIILVMSNGTKKD